MARYADFSEDAATALASGILILIVNVRDWDFSKSRQSCFEYPAKGGVRALPVRDSMNVSRFPWMLTVTPNRSCAPIAAA